MPIKAAIEENTSERCSYAFAIIAALFILFPNRYYTETSLLSLQSKEYIAKIVIPFGGSKSCEKAFIDEIAISIPTINNNTATIIAEIDSALP